MDWLRQSGCVVLGCLVSPALLGCAGLRGTSGAGPVAVPQIRGSVHGGQQPVAGSTIQLYAAGTGGYGAGAQSLLTTPVTTDAGGAFTITGAYTCPSATSQLYIVATGGNPGLAAGTNNAAIALMAALGPCELLSGQYTLDPSSFISINEVTTVASVYALAGFMDSTTSQVGTSAGNAVGLANAFATVNNLVDVSTGQALATTPAGNGMVPQAEINTLANILAGCVNSDGTGAECAALQAATTPSGGSAPTNTLQATLNIVRSPASDAATLYGLATPQGPFQPTLTAAPNDWTVQVAYSFSPLTFYPTGMAVDASGDIWIVNRGAPGSIPVQVVELSNAGAVLSGASGYGTSAGFGGALAIDPAGNVWVTTAQPASVVKLSPTGTLLSGSGGYTLSGLTEPVSLALDGAGSAWVANRPTSGSDTVFKLASDGTNLSGATGFALGGANSPAAIAVDSAGDAWLSNANLPPDVIELNDSGGVVYGTFADALSVGGAGDIAIDAAGSVWTTDYASAALFEVSHAGVALSGTEGFPYCTNVSLYTCNGGTVLTMDGAGSVWVPVFYNEMDRLQVIRTVSSVAVVNNSGALVSGTMGYVTSIPPGLIAVDNSGNVWMADRTAVEMVGAATPVATPLSVGARDGKLGSRP